MAKQAMTNKKLRSLGLGGGSGIKSKLVGLALIAFVLWRVITAPVESAHFVGDVASGLVTFAKAVL
ncbi:hypothetical protein VSH64_37050 [Amycolatopsis rhabdoformis]|uniref:Uncharacterized protein n=1 Tax=Amycolatopsis rhabdoformis TaxID=1448059 RepID=A0ABZ1I2K9_9PSEU|nr:hypothetical protein [Amycolatopsis rhabdoformis]WSE28404.1 hypothetical protein VSH64_37050 [Amycolatopsis rhabdoformis]